MAKHVKAIPAGFHTVTPTLIVRNGAEAIEFYRRAFGGEELNRMLWPDGRRIMHAALQIGDSKVFLADEDPGTGCRSPQSLGGTPTQLHLYVENVDAAFERAVKAGANVQMPLADTFWGDRYGKLVDPYGHEWSLASRIEDVPEDEMRRRAEAFFKEQGGRRS